MTTATAQVRQITTESEAVELAKRLNSANRTRPIVVVTTPAGQSTPRVDAARIADEVGDAVDVVVLSTGAASWAFSDEMPPGTQVYGGAARAYPIGTDWVRDLGKSPLRFAYNAGDGRRAADMVISDALSMAVAAGLMGRTASKSAPPDFRGTVTGCIAGRALVRGDNGKPATIVPELAFPGVSIECIARPGMRVAGLLDSSGRLDVRASVRGVDALAYQPGQIVLGRIDAVTASAAKIALHPEYAVSIDQSAFSPDELDHLDDWFSVGEVVRARVTGTSPWSLTLIDVDDDEAVHTFSLLDGGPPWLIESRDAPAEGAHAESDELEAALEQEPEATPGAIAAAEPEPASAPTTAAPIPSMIPRAPSQSAQVSSLAAALEAANTKLRNQQQQIENLFAERDALAEALTSARARNEQLRSGLAKRNLEARKSRSAETQADERLFADPVVQFTHDVYVAWARRIGPEEKDQRPLKDYELSPHFLASMDRIEGISRGKIVEVVVEVLTGIAETQPGRALHPLRSDLGGDSPARTREDGSVAWRVSLQTGTPSARRLHYWRKPDGVIQLGKVVLHDDFTI